MNIAQGVGHEITVSVARFDPAGTQIDDAFGTVMPDGSPRIVQLAVRFVF